MQHGDRLHRERFVELEQIDVVERPADLLGHAPHGLDRRHQHELRREAAGRLADDARERRRGRATAARSSAITTSADAPSLTPGALPAVTVPSFLNAGFSARERLDGRVGADRLVPVDDDRRGPFFCGIETGRISSANAPALGRRAPPSGGCAPRRRPARSRPTWYCSATTSPALPMWQLLERAPQAVVDHRVDDLAVAHAQPFAHARQQVRAVAHRLHAAGDGDVDVAGADALVGEHHGLEARAAHLVDGQRGDVVGEPAAERRLPRRVLSEARADDVAHDALVDDRRVDARRGGRLRRTTSAPSCGRGEVLQRAEELAGGRANGADDDGVHDSAVQGSGFTDHGSTLDVRGSDVARRSTTIVRRRRGRAASAGGAG